MSDAAAKTILTIDGETQTRAALAGALRDAGYPVAETSGVAEAFTYLDERPPPALILLEVPPPGMDTMTFLWRLRSSIPEPFPPVIAVTRATVIGDAWAKAYGFAGLIRKPIDPGKAVPMVRDCLEPGQPSTPCAG